MKELVSSIKVLFTEFVKLAPPGLFLSASASGIAGGKYFNSYVNEFVGTLLMIGLTFSPGKWVGADSLSVAWTFHMFGVIAADYLGGGQQVNPMMTMTMFALGKVDYTEAFVRVAGQMGGGLIAFPLFHALSEAMNLTPFGGPEFKLENDIEAAISEFVACFLLCWAIYIVSGERMMLTARAVEKKIQSSCACTCFCLCSSTGSSTLEAIIT